MSHRPTKKKKKQRRGKRGIISAGVIESFDIAQAVTIDVIMVKTKDGQFLSMTTPPHLPLIFETEGMARLRAEDAGFSDFEVVRGTVTFQEKPKNVKLDK